MAVIRCKTGVRFRQFPPGLLRILEVLGQIALDGQALVPGLPNELVITSANDSEHLPTSRHYRDEALDIRCKSFPNQATKDIFCMTLRARLGPKFTVLHEYPGGEQEHVHIQVRKGGTYP